MSEEKTNPFAWSGGIKFYQTMDAMQAEIERLQAENMRLKDALADTSRTNFIKTEG